MACEPDALALALLHREILRGLKRAGDVRAYLDGARVALGRA